jgi:Fe-S cluster biogenesis protein NfuA
MWPSEVQVIRTALKRGLKRVLGMDEPERAPVPPAPAWRDTAVPPAAVTPAPVAAAAVQPASAAAEPEPAAAEPKPAAAEPEPVPTAAPVAVAAPTPPESPTADLGADTVGPALTLESLQAVMDEMVRPALQGDGGDITLIKIEANDVYVKLVGACSTCPSSIMTMKLGVEALLKEEFPSMNQLISVD